jgi:hypothetical protein
MIAFTVHEPPDPPADRMDRAESLVFVRDGFSLWAMLFAPVWMALKGLWLVLLGYLVVIALLTVPFVLVSGGEQWLALALTLLHLLIGFEASSLKRWTLDRKGWRYVASVTGRSTGDCERRFFEEWLPGAPLLDSGRLTAPASTMDLTRPLHATRTSRSWWRPGFKDPL